ncbi:Nucleolar Complex 2 protein [Saxophila tyrrhenica]|uniref:Nucleolar Complex 2 protein n=1 Tax=Saxophila tyrrhenica TaxID=1690608 RepID=A0AAV9PE64_9PEZI|nr:Nucleolar Complex 2 protein [Saxophila tyrrhenica]
MPQSKQQKKFEKKHLKDVLERRKGLKKVKQRQQINAKKKARRAEEEGRPAPGEKHGDEVKKDVRNGKKAGEDKFKDMSVDEFFQGGFEVPELPQEKGKKRKREAPKEQQEESGSEGSDVSFEQAPVSARLADGGDSGSEDDEDLEGHRQQLDALAENDPEFHKYLQENEPELLGGELEGVEALSEEEEEAPKRKKPKKTAPASDESEDEEVDGARKNELTKAMVSKWRTAITKEHSLRAAREVVLAFRAAAHVSDEEDDLQFKYSISDPAVYHELLTLALKHIPDVFQHHLPVQESKSGKVHVSLESKRFKTLGPLLKSHVASIMHLLDHLSDASTLRMTLSSTLPLLPYLLSFKKLVRNLAKAVTNIWSSSSNAEATRIAAFLVLRRLTTISDAGIRENVLKTVYQGLVKGSRNTTIHTVQGMNLMKNSASELWGLVDPAVAYTTSFTFVRQLAIHLRTSIHNTAKEGYKNVYNWQYVHSLDFWSRVLSAHAIDPASNMRPLIYPLVQVTLGALRLIPTATYFPLRFHLSRSLLRLSRTTNTFIPLAAPLYEVLTSAEMRKAPKPSTLKPLDFSVSIRAPKGYLRTRVYQDGVGEQVQELLGEFFVLWCKNVAFPELSLPVNVVLKRWLKDVNRRAPGEGNKNQKVNGMIQLLVQKLEANARHVEDKRGKVEFAPNDRTGVEGFLQEVGWDKMPLGAFVGTLRRQREEREKVAEEARREDERRRSSGDKEKKGEEVGSESESEEDEMVDGISEDEDEVMVDGVGSEDEEED